MIGRSQLLATFCLLTNAILVPLLAAEPSTQPAAPAANPVMVNLSVDQRDMTVGRFLPHLQQQFPEFQYVAQPGQWQDFPLPALHLQNLSVGQVVQMLTNLYPELEVDELHSTNQFMPAPEGPTLYVFKNRPGPGPQSASGRVMAMGLADAIDRMAMRKARAAASPPSPQQFADFRKEATDELLSLLQAAISQVPAQEEPSLKLHKETEVLLIRGEDRQLKAASQALDALTTADDPKRYESQYVELLNRYQTLINQRQNQGNQGH
jgi:hypothetical protein